MTREVLIIAAVLTSFCAGASPAAGNSIGFHLEEADLVAAGTVVGLSLDDGRFDVYGLQGAEAVKGRLPDGSVCVLAARHMCYHVELREGRRMLLFLRRMTGDIGLNLPGVPYMALAADLSAVDLEDEEGALLLDAARLQASVLEAPETERARVTAGILRSALEPGRPRLLRSILVDAVRTPGVLPRLDALDRSRMLDRFRETAPASELKLRLLDALGEARPEGMTNELVRTVRGPDGGYHRDQIAAILAGTGDASVSGFLVLDFPELDPATRANVVYVLGRLGAGRGVSAIRDVMRMRIEGVQTAAVEALRADRSADALAALEEIAGAAHRENDAEAALAALAAINTRESRSILERITERPGIRASIREKAAEFLNRLAR